MPTQHRHIGLSLGADICWPICFEEIIKRLGPISYRGESFEVGVERLTIEPFELTQPCRYDVVLDRLTHWYHTSREWIKKAVILDDLYVFNNPWSLQSMEKHTSYCAMMRLGLPVPDTWMVPPKEYEPTTDLAPTLERYAHMFDLGEIGRALGFPMFMKPYDGGAWVGVNRIENEEQLRAAYEKSGRRVMHLQRAVEGFDLFVRCLAVGPQVRIIKYDPGAPLHERYVVDFGTVDADEWSLLEDTVLTINSFFCWDFNSCEALRKDGVFHLIDFANACPDSQVTSLHYYFPWLVKSKVRWALFAAVTDRAMRRNLEWEPFFEIAARDLPPRERLAEYGRLARRYLDAEAFQEFAGRQLGHLDEVAWEFFGSDTAHDAVRQKVTALFPEHEVEQFTEHFWGLIQFWRRTERDRLDAEA
ncbi:MAG: hypothetical protein R3325_11290, partial [Thermoanaerobaculia bacterium]|nr:hypothetical protein [Thermoanaerobaculia bacterium]